MPDTPKQPSPPAEPTRAELIAASPGAAGLLSVELTDSAALSASATSASTLPPLECAVFFLTEEAAGRASLDTSALQPLLPAAAVSTTPTTWQDFTGRSKQTLFLYPSSASSVPRILLVGLGGAKDVAAGTIRSAVHAMMAALKAKKITRAAVAVPVDASPSLSVRALLDTVTRIAVLSNHTFSRYLTKKEADKHHVVEHLHLVLSATPSVSSPTASSSYAEVVHRAQTIAEGVLLGRELANDRGDVITPSALETFTTTLARTHSLPLDVVKGERLTAEGLTLISAVGQGSKDGEQARILVLSYTGDPARAEDRIALVGKAITFDTSAAPQHCSTVQCATDVWLTRFPPLLACCVQWRSEPEVHRRHRGDESGQERRLRGARRDEEPRHTQAAHQRHRRIGRGGELHRRALHQAARHPPHSQGQRGGPYHTRLRERSHVRSEPSLSRSLPIPVAVLRTVLQVSNTDAEGRLALADTFTYLQRYFAPHTIVDIATLTGACVVALGEHVAGLWGNDGALSARLIEAGKRCAEDVHPMPIHASHREALKGVYSDTRSTGKAKGGGACVAAAFLSRFIDEGRKWAHLDIAGPAMLSEAKEWRCRGGTAFGTQLLTDFVLSEADRREAQSANSAPTNPANHAGGEGGIERALAS